jgi:hypothetical protein
LHIAGAAVALTLIGFEVMTANLILALQAYSSSLTMSVCTIYLYLFFLLDSFAGGITWITHFKEYGSGGNKKGLNEFQEISILAISCLYIILFVWNMRTMRKFR